MPGQPLQRRLVTVVPRGNELDGDQGLSSEEIFALEEIHSLVLDTQALVSAAHELDRDDLRSRRLSVLVETAHGLLEDAAERMTTLVSDIYRRRRRQVRARR